MNYDTCANCGNEGNSDEMIYCAGNSCTNKLCANCYEEEVQKTTGEEFEVDIYDYPENEHDIECIYCKGALTDEELIEHALILLGISREDLITSASTAKVMLGKV